jgi:DNA-binding response OmpR family regulator
MGVVAFLADPDADVERVQQCVAGEFPVEVVDAPLARAALERLAPAALVVRWELAAADLLAALRTGAGVGAAADLPPVLVLARPNDLTGEALDLWDDFVLWPWDTTETCARLHRLTRTVAGGDSPLHWGKLQLDTERHEAEAAGAPLDLTYTEFRLLALLMTLRGKVLTRERAYREIWKSDHFGGLRTVDVHIRRLRSKLERHSCPYVGTVRNVGYRLRDIA